jgi:hypothetical protein
VIHRHHYLQLSGVIPIEKQSKDITPGSPTTRNSVTEGHHSAAPSQQGGQTAGHHAQDRETLGVADPTADPEL